MKLTTFWDLQPCILVELYRRFKRAYFFYHQGREITMKMEAVRTYETSVYFYETTRQSAVIFIFRCRENLKPHQVDCIVMYEHNTALFERSGL
jgi:hypothetical protein